MSAVVNRLLRAFALVVTDRRWAAPLSAAALGFGLFVGVAIGPNAAGTLAGATQILEMPAGDDEEGADVEAGTTGGLGGSLDGGSGAGLAEAPLGPAPLAPIPAAPAPARAEPPPRPAPPSAEAPEEEGEEETQLKGVVVQANPAAGSYALAIKGGELVPVHARKLPPPGAKLAVIARRLANGTFAEAEPPERSGKAAQASFRGVVTYADPSPSAPAYTVSGRGASLLVHVEPEPAGTVPQLPATGSYVTVTVELRPHADPAAPSPSGEPVPSAEAPATAVAAPAPEPSCARDPSLPLPQVDPPATLWQRQLEIEPGEPSAYLDLAGVLTAVCPEAGRILLSADGVGEREATVALAVPGKIDTGELQLGDSVIATATVGPDGSLMLAGVASDERLDGADDPQAAQGDLKRLLFR